MMLRLISETKLSKVRGSDGRTGARKAPLMIFVCIVRQIEQCDRVGSRWMVAFDGRDYSNRGSRTLLILRVPDIQDPSSLTC